MAGKIVRFAVAGVGSRGTTYSSYLMRHPDEARVVAAADPDSTALGVFGARFDVPKNRRFADWKSLLDVADEFDAVIVATPDFYHTEPALAFSEAGKHVLLEKPMAPTEEECRRIVAAANGNGAIFAVCHVLRYTPWTKAVKEVVESGRIGQVQCVQLLEPIGYYHYAHSFVRGNWRSTKSANFMLMSKSCHDLDWLRYIVDADCRRVGSFGSLEYFNADHKPNGASDRCTTCPVAGDCPYSAQRIYLGAYDLGFREWPLDVLVKPVTREGVEAAVASGPYGRCVFACDNDVVDRQVVNLEYTNGVVATFTVAAFTQMGNRRFTILGTRGELRCDGTHIDVFEFMTERIERLDVELPALGHADGDAGLIESFMAAVVTGNSALVRSSPSESLESHLTAFAGERARLSGTVESIRM